MSNNEKVLISPDLTHQEEWIIGTVIETEKNSFVGTVITAKTEEGDIFFGKEDQFKPAKN